MVNIHDFGFDFLQPVELPEEDEEDWYDSPQENTDPDPVEETSTQNMYGDIPDEVDMTLFPTSKKDIRYKTLVLSAETRRNKRRTKPKKKMGRKPKRYKEIRGVVYKINYKYSHNDLATYEEARQFCIDNDIKSHVEFRDYAKIKGLPKNIPSAYVRYYKKTGDWVDAKHFFSKETNVMPRDQSYLDYNTARKLLARIGTITDWASYVDFVAKYNKDRKYNRLPTKPYIYYPEYHSLSHYLSIRKINSNMKKGCALTYDQAREFVSSLGIRNQVEWKEYTKSKAFPYFLYKLPDRAYLEWKGWKHFLDVPEDISDFLDKKARTDVLLGLFVDPTDHTVFVYQIFSGGEPAIHNFEITTRFRVVRMYEFDVRDNHKWVNLVTAKSDYHEMNMFTTHNINELLFTADAILPIRKGR